MNYPTVSSEPKKVPMVQEQIDIIKGNLDLLVKSVSVLGSRLAPVSRSEPNRVSEAKSPKDQVAMPPVPSELHDIAALINSIGLTIEELTRLLEI